MLNGLLMQTSNNPVIHKSTNKITMSTITASSFRCNMSNPKIVLQCHGREKIIDTNN
jgi:hypothetical protein